MPVAETRLYFDNQPADEARRDAFADIRVDQAIGLAAEAELQLDIAADDAGRWSDIEADFTQAFARVRVEIKVGAGDFVALIDGPVVRQRYELSGAPNESRLVLVVQDDSVLLNQRDEIELFEDLAPHEIARLLFQRNGLAAEVDDTPGASGGLSRAIVQRGTAMQLLRELARRHGRFVYVKPGTTPGASTGVFARPNPAANGLPELLLMGADRNTNRFHAEFDALRPLAAQAAGVSITDKAILSAEATASSLTALGDSPAHGLVTPGQSLLARTREDASDLDAATAAVVDHSSWAYSANAEVVADAYAGVLAPYQVVRVAGAGGHLAGDYLISQVSHQIGDDGYRQTFTLRRNARSRGGSGGGGLPSGVF